MLTTVLVDVIDHPVVAAQLTEMRATATDRPRFRDLLHRVSRSLVYEAARATPTKSITIDTPMGSTEGVELVRQPVLVPILRSGLGMLDAALEALPDSETGFIGLKRDEATLRPEVYMNTIPQLNERTVFLLDPMLATGGSANFAAAQARDRGAGELTLVVLLAAPEGIELLRNTGAVDRVVTASIDSHLNEIGFIVPGLGDAGDRQYGVD
jgi:uracil phosphoribosyltransferase